MQKICHVTSAHPEEDGRIFRRACLSASREGYDTYLVEKGNSYIKEGVHIIGIGEPQNPGRLYRMSIFAYKAIKTAIKVDADLYHLHDPELLPYAMFLKRRGKKVVFDSHENYVEQIKHKPYLPNIVAEITSTLYDKFSRRAFSKIDGLTYPGNEGEPSFYDGMCSCVAPTDNLPWLEELYDNYDPDSEKEPYSACYIGALDEARGISLIIEAAFDANCTLYLAGHFSSESYKRALQAKKEYSCVRYLGTLNREQITSLLKKTEIGLCVLPDIGQYHKMLNLPTKVYEYMSMGVPVVLNRSPYNEKINNDIEFGICVDANDREDVAQALKVLTKNKELRDKLGINGRKSIKEKYCWDKAQHSLLDMYKLILDK